MTKANQPRYRFIAISPDVHQRIKQHCAARDGVTIKDFTEGVIIQYLDRVFIEIEGVQDA